MKNKNEILIKVGRALMVLVLLGGMLASCSKDKNNEDNLVNRADYEREYFNIQNGDFSGRPLPNANSTSLELLDISGNPTILAGGSNFINISATENASEVIIGVDGQDGYFTLPLEAETLGGRGVNASSMHANLQLLIGREVSESFNIAIATTDGQGNYSAYEYLEVTLMAAGTGLLQISLSWDRPNDVDLHLIEPNGTEIYYGNRTSDNGGKLDVDSNAGCGIDNINNENIDYADSPDVFIENGEYEVLVDLWSDCQVQEDTKYIIVVYYGGERIATSVGSNPHYGVLLPEDASRNTNLTSVMKFTIDGPPENRNMASRNLPSIPKAYMFNYDQNNKVFKNFAVKKE